MKRKLTAVLLTVVMAAAMAVIASNSNPSASAGCPEFSLVINSAPAIPMIIAGQTDLSGGAVVALTGCICVGTYKNLAEGGMK